MQSSYGYDAIKLADKLNRDYYPLAELLCKNAMIQAGWLHEQDSSTEMNACLQLCNDLNEVITQHLLICKTALSFLSEGQQTVYIRSEELLATRRRIKDVLSAISEATAEKKAVEWTEMHNNLCMKLKVLHNLLFELFKIEDADLLPVLAGRLQ